MITIYKTPNCAYCAQTTKYLNLKQKSYQVIDILETPSAEYEELAQLYGRNFPLVYNGHMGYTGWNLRVLNEMING